jgi:hypothetical protein
MNSNPEVEKLKARIIEAWKDIQYPGDSNLLTVPPYDSMLLEMEEMLLGKTWQEAIPYLFKHVGDYDTSSINMLTPEAFQYYFQSFLIGALSSEKNREGRVWEAFLVSTNPPLYEPWLEYFIPLIEILSKEQRNVIKDAFA